MIPRPLRSLWNFTYDVYDRFARHYGWAIASHVALAALLSFFPFLIMVVSLASLIGTQAASTAIVGLAFEGWPAGVADPLSAEIGRVLTGRRSDLLTVGALVTLWISSSGVEALRVALSNAYATADERAWYYLRLQSMLFVLLGAVAFFVLAIAVILWPTIWEFGIRAAPALETVGIPAATVWSKYQLVTDVVRFTLTGLFLGTSLVVFHIWLATGRRRVRDVLPGVALTILLWLVAGWAFGVYLANFANYASTYAGLGGVIAAIFFLYLNSVAFIIGAEFNAALSALGATGHMK